MQYLSGLASPVICTGGSRKSEESATKQGNAPHKCESGDHFNFVAGISPCGKGQMNCQDITHTSGTLPLTLLQRSAETSTKLQSLEGKWFLQWLAQCVDCSLRWSYANKTNMAKGKQQKKQIYESYESSSCRYFFHLSFVRLRKLPSSEMRTATCWSLIFRLAHSGSSPYAWLALSHGEHPVRA